MAERPNGPQGPGSGSTGKGSKGQIQPPANLGQSSTPSRVNPEATKALQDFAAVSKDMKGSVDHLTKAMKGIESVLAGTNKGFEDFYSSLADTVEEIENVEDAYKALGKTQRQIAGSFDLFKGRSREDILKFIKQIEYSQKELEKNDKLSQHNKEQLKKNLQEITKLHKDIEGLKKSDVNHDKKLLEYEQKLTDELRKQSKEMTRALEISAKLAAHRKWMSQPLTTRIAGRMREFNDVTGGGIGRFMGSTRLGQSLSGFNSGVSANQGVTAGLNKAMEWNANRIAVNRELLASGQGGPSGMVDKWLTNKLVSKGASSVVEMGGGSALRGLGARLAGGAAEAGAGGGLLGGASALMQRAAGPIAILGAINSMRDKLIDLDVDTQSKIGAGGMMAGAGSGDVRARFNMYRSFLGSASYDDTWRGTLGRDQAADLLGGYVKSGYGVGPKTIQGLGSLSNLENFHTMGNVGNSALGGAMYNAVYQSKGIGLSQQEGLQVSMDIMDKYKETATGAVGYFAKLDKWISASGLSTHKYLEVLDSVNDNFDQMNRSLRLTSMLLDGVSRSGRFTGDMLKQIVGGLTGPTGMNDAQQLLAAQNIVKSPGLRQGMQAGAKQQMDYTGDQLQGTLKGFEGDINNYNEVSRFIAEKVPEGERQTAQRALEAYQNAKQAFGTLANPNATAMDILGTTKFMGENAVSAMGMNFAQLKDLSAESGTSMADLLNGKVDYKTARIASESLGIKDLKGLISSIRGFGTSSASNVFDVATSGKEGGPSDTLLANVWRAYKPKESANMSTEDAATAARELIKNGSEGEKNDLYGFISGNIDLLSANNAILQKIHDNALSAEDKKAQLEKQRAMDEQTTNMGDALARSFEYLFMRVVAGIEKVAKFLGVDSAENKSQKEFTSAFSGLIAGAPADKQEALKGVLDRANNLSGMSKDQRQDILNQIRKIDPNVANRLSGALMAGDIKNGFFGSQGTDRMNALLTDISGGGDWAKKELGIDSLDSEKGRGTALGFLRKFDAGGSWDETSKAGSVSFTSDGSSLGEMIKNILSKMSGAQVNGASVTVNNYATTPAQAPDPPATTGANKAPGETPTSKPPKS